MRPVTIETHFGQCDRFFDVVRQWILSGTRDLRKVIRLSLGHRGCSNGVFVKSFIKCQLIGKEYGSKVLAVLIDVRNSPVRVSSWSGVICRQMGSLCIVNIVNTTLKSIGEEIKNFNININDIKDTIEI